MRVVLVTSGTRGDVQPMAVLALELAKRGHEPVVAVPRNLVDFGTRTGVTTVAFGPDTQAFMESPEGAGWLAAGNVSTFMKAMMAFSKRHIEQTVTDLINVSEGADLLVAGLLAEDLVLPVAEAAAIPMVALHSAPVRRTVAVANPLVTTRALPGLLNSATHALFERVWWKGVRDEVGSLRARLGLPTDGRPTAVKLASAGATELQVYSPLLVPGLEADYGARRPLVGFLDPDVGLRSRLGESGVSAELERWLAEGDPPVFVGFGSMPILDPSRSLGMVSRVTRRLGVRALVSAGWGRLEVNAAAPGAVGDHVMGVGTLDHAAVLPRCRAAVHHGGAGTTAAAVTAGLPSVVCSVFADQPFWGTQLERLGVGAHVRFAALDEQSLTSALERVLTSDVAARAADLGARMRGEPDAAERAADLVEAAA